LELSSPSLSFPATGGPPCEHSLMQKVSLEWIRGRLARTGKSVYCQN